MYQFLALFSNLPSATTYLQKTQKPSHQVQEDHKQ
jgi:hypothetical protein